MSDERKARPDSKLKTLPPARQDQIWDMAQGMTLKELRAALHADGIDTSESALSAFLKGRRLKTQFDGAADFSDKLMTLLRQEQPGLTDEQIERYGQRVFQLRAIETESDEAWARVQAIALRKQKLEFEKDKFRNAVKTAIERGLDALHEEIKASAEALAIFERLKAVVMAKVEGAK